MTQETIGKYRWTICALLFFATTVNYLDRQVLSLLKPMLEDKFGWTNTDYANMLPFSSLLMLSPCCLPAESLISWAPKKDMPGL